MEPNAESVLTDPQPRSAAPRYMALAESLRARIARGEPDVGELLPTEHVLCDTYNVSRHTVREALRLLADAGLIARRRGAGTVVIARETRAAFAQRLGGVDDLMAYARDARLTPLQEETVAMQGALARALGAPDGGRFRKIKGLRGLADKPPLALTDIYVREDLCPSVEAFVELNGLVMDWIEENKGVAPARITQSISAGALSEEEAEALCAAPGSPALRVRRRYHAVSGAMIAMSDSVHPADRFSYEMTLKRESDARER